MELFDSQLLSEFLGTLFLILLGNGVVYSVSGTKMFANQPGKWVVVAMGWGFGVLVGVIISQALGGSGHLNPAVSIYAAISNKDAKILAYIPMQILGAMAGQIILNFINWRHIGETDLVTVRSAHCTSPAYENKGKTTIFNFSYEFVGTAVLLSVILALSKNQNITLANLGPLPVTFLVMSIGMSLGSSTGYAINPARDLGPRIIYFAMEKLLMKKRTKEFIGASFSSYGWLPVVAPSLAGVVIGLFGLIQ